MSMTISSCIGCGCTDDHACDGGCWWMRVDRSIGKGVCSQCEEFIAAWDAGVRVERYRPSNGTEGDCFIAAFCYKCGRDKALSEGEPIDECDDNERCDIVGRSFLHSVEEPEYPVEWTYDKHGIPCCTAFVAKGAPIPAERCKYTVDMFEELP